MADINLLFGLSNVVLIWCTIYSAVITIKWQFEDRQKDAVTVKEKETLVRELLKEHLNDWKTMEKRVEHMEKQVKAAIEAKNES